MQKFFTILLLIFSLLAPTRFALSDTILSKDDAAAMFNLSFSEWKQNALAVQEAGLAKYESLAPLEVTLIAEDAPFGRVVTTPSYKSADSLPWKLSVAVIFNRAASQVYLSLPSTEHEISIRDIYHEMMPEYTVMTDIFLPNPEGLVAKSFQVFRYGDFPPLDAAAERNEGCWQKCLKYSGQ